MRLRNEHPTTFLHPLLLNLLRVVTIVPRIMEDAGFFHHLSRWTGFTWLLNETLISASLLIDVSCPRSFLILLSLSFFSHLNRLIFPPDDPPTCFLLPMIQRIVYVYTLVLCIHSFLVDNYHLCGKREIRSPIRSLFLLTKFALDKLHVSKKFPRKRENI